jgi:hypothetical protein
MRRTFVHAAVLVCVAFIAAVPIYSQGNRTIELTAQELLARVDNVLRYPKGALSGSITHIFPDGRSFSLLLKGSMSDDDYLFVIGSPERGDQFKVLYNLGGEDIWVYSITSLQLFHKIDIDRFDPILSTNFSYLDLSNADLQSNYTARIEGDSIIKGKECYRLKCEPIYKKGDYGYLTIFVSKVDFIPLKIDYYDQDRVIMKSMSVAQVAQFAGRNFPVRYDMLHVKSGTLSIMKFSNFDPSISFNKEIFRHQSLDK